MRILNGIMEWIAHCFHSLTLQDAVNKRFISIIPPDELDFLELDEKILIWF